MHLEGRGIRFITNLESCFAVRVLYLYSNRIQAINGLENLRQLTHLYLQVQTHTPACSQPAEQIAVMLRANVSTQQFSIALGSSCSLLCFAQANWPWVALQKNQIQKIEGLENLGRLQKLYLEDNEISCVESLEGCTSLQELHLSRQRLPAGVELAFDPNCLEVCPGKIWQRHAQQLVAETRVVQLEDTSNVPAHAVQRAACQLMPQNLAMKMLTKIAYLAPLPSLARNNICAAPHVITHTSYM